ncbi:MAG: hypothetical protein [Microviridae sp.]|nr:MAG: hypothetical protein [Microviridae sp.]
MARRQRKRRQKLRAHEHRTTYVDYIRNPQQQTRFRGKITTTKRRHVVALSNVTRPLNQRRQTQSRQLNRVLSRVGVSDPTRLIQLQSLQAQPSSQTRKDHKCIKKPNSQKAGKGSGKYKGQWKPWCL